MSEPALGECPGSEPRGGTMESSMDEDGRVGLAGRSAAGRFSLGRRLGLGLVLALSGSGLSGSAAAEIDRPSVRAEMREIHASIQVLLPLSVEDEAFRSPAARESIRAALSRLAAHAGEVAGHAAGGDRRIEYLGGLLEDDAKEALRRFEAGQLGSAKFFTQRLTDFCVSCHSRLPSATDSALTLDFSSDAALETLSLSRRASLQVATRRFDEAMASFEALFASPDVRPAELLEPLTEYLSVAIRVKGDLERPVPVLEKLLERPDLWTNLRSDVQRWVETLKREAAKGIRPATLEAARALLDEARDIIRHPSDRRALVHDLLASSALHRVLEQHAGESSRDVAEAYYWLGLIETRINLNDWIFSEADFYLETAIRMAPRDPVGGKAFALLEEQTVLGWSGSGGDHMPPVVRQKLEALRVLVESSPREERSPRDETSS